MTAEPSEEEITEIQKICAAIDQMERAQIAWVMSGQYDLNKPEDATEVAEVLGNVYYGTGAVQLFEQMLLVEKLHGDAETVVQSAEYHLHMRCLEVCDRAFNQPAGVRNEGGHFVVRAYCIGCGTYGKDVIADLGTDAVSAARTLESHLRTPLDIGVLPLTGHPEWHIEEGCPL